MDAVIDQTRTRGMRKGSAVQLSRLQYEDPTQVDAEEAPDQISSHDHSERRQHFKRSMMTIEQTYIILHLTENSFITHSRFSFLFVEKF